MAALTSKDLGKEFCKIFGLDPKFTGKITININPGEFSLVTIEQLIDDTNLDKFLIVFNKYYLTEVPPSKPKEE